MMKRMSLSYSCCQRMNPNSPSCNCCFCLPNRMIRCCSCYSLVMMSCCVKELSTALTAMMTLRASILTGCCCVRVRSCCKPYRCPVLTRCCGWCYMKVLN